MGPVDYHQHAADTSVVHEAAAATANAFSLAEEASHDPLGAAARGIGGMFREHDRHAKRSKSHHESSLSLMDDVM